MMSTSARASAAHTQPDNPDDELVGATAAVDTGADVVAAAGSVVAADVPAADVSAVDSAAVGEPAADDAAGAGAPVNWNFTSPTTG